MKICISTRVLREQTFHFSPLPTASLMVITIRLHCTIPLDHFRYIVSKPHFSCFLPCLYVIVNGVFRDIALFPLFLFPATLVAVALFAHLCSSNGKRTLTERTRLLLTYIPRKMQRR